MTQPSDVPNVVNNKQTLYFQSNLRLLLWDVNVLSALSRCFKHATVCDLKKSLLQKLSANINLPLDVDNATLFAIYCQYAPYISFNTVKVFGNLSANFNSPDNLRRTAFHWIMFRFPTKQIQEIEEIVRYLLKNEANPLFEDFNENSAFLMALSSRYCSVSLIKAFLNTLSYDKKIRVCACNISIGHSTACLNSGNIGFQLRDKLILAMCKRSTIEKCTSLHLAATVCRSQPSHKTDVLVYIVDQLELHLSPGAVSYVVTALDARRRNVLSCLFSPTPSNFSSKRKTTYCKHYETCSCPDPCSQCYCGCLLQCVESVQKSPATHSQRLPAVRRFPAKNWTRQNSPDAFLRRILKYRFNFHSTSTSGDTDTIFYDAVETGAYITPTLMRLIPKHFSQPESNRLLAQILRHGRGNVLCAVEIVFSKGATLAKSSNVDWISLVVSNPASTRSLLEVFTSRGSRVAYPHITESLISRRLRLTSALLANPSISVKQSIRLNCSWILKKLCWSLSADTKQASHECTLQSVIAKLVTNCNLDIATCLAPEYVGPKTYAHVATNKQFNGNDIDIMSVAHILVAVSSDAELAAECMNALDYIGKTLKTQNTAGSDERWLMYQCANVWIPRLNLFVSVSPLTYAFALGHYVIAEKMIQNFVSLYDLNLCLMSNTPGFSKAFRCLYYSGLRDFPTCLITDDFQQSDTLACQKAAFDQEMASFMFWLKLETDVERLWCLDTLPWFSPKYPGTCISGTVAKPSIPL